MKRWIPLALAVAAYFVLSLVWIGSDKRVAGQVFEEYSSENRSDQGLSLARSYLAQSGPRHVAVLDGPLAPDAIERNAVVFRVGELLRVPNFNPDQDANEGKHEKGTPKNKGKKKQVPQAARDVAESLLTSDEEEWVRGGGRLVIATSEDYGPLTVHAVTSRNARKVFPIWPGLDALRLPSGRALSGAEALRRMHALYDIDNEPAMARTAIGRGDVIAMASPELFANKQLDVSSLTLLSALAGHDRPIYFDETVHGMAASHGMLELLLSWRLGPFLLLALMTTLIVCWRAGKRIGEPEDDYRDVRSEAVDLVSSLGALYDRTMTGGGAIAMYHHELTRAVAAQSGLRGEALQRRVASLTHEMLVPSSSDKIEGSEFATLLATINEGFRKLER